MEGMALDEVRVVALSTGLHGGNRAIAFEDVHAVSIEQDKVRVQDRGLRCRSRFGRGENGSNSNGKSQDEKSSN
jgi:hypothetical protein